MPTPTPGADPIVDLVCQYFGGPYDAANRAYITSIIPGVGTWRRGWDKLNDFNEYIRGMAPGTSTGSMFVVQVTRGIEHRLTFPAVQGRKHNTLQVTLHGYFWSTAAYSEDTQDAVYAVRQAIVAALRADPTLGTGGMEAGWFHVGIPDEHGGGGEITWTQTVPVTVDRGATKQGLIVDFEAHEIPVG